MMVAYQPGTWNDGKNVVVRMGNEGTGGRPGMGGYGSKTSGMRFRLLWTIIEPDVIRCYANHGQTAGDPWRVCPTSTPSCKDYSAGNWWGWCST